MEREEGGGKWWRVSCALLPVCVCCGKEDAAMHCISAVRGGASSDIPELHLIYIYISVSCQLGVCLGVWLVRNSLPYAAVYNVLVKYSATSENRPR